MMVPCGGCIMWRNIAWWYDISVYKVCESRTRRMNIICNDLILYRSLEHTEITLKILGMRTDRQTDKLAITKIETQFYKLSIETQF